MNTAGMDPDDLSALATELRVEMIAAAGATKDPAVVLALVTTWSLSVRAARTILEALPDVALHPKLRPMVDALDPATDPDAAG